MALLDKANWDWTICSRGLPSLSHLFLPSLASRVRLKPAVAMAHHPRGTCGLLGLPTQDPWIIIMGISPSGRAWCCDPEISGCRQKRLQSPCNASTATQDPPPAGPGVTDNLHSQVSACVWTVSLGCVCVCVGGLHRQGSEQRGESGQVSAHSGMGSSVTHCH